MEPLSGRAEHWLHAITDDESIWIGPVLVVEIRFFPKIADAAIEAGLTFQRAALLN